MIKMADKKVASAVIIIKQLIKSNNSNVIHVKLATKWFKFKYKNSKKIFAYKIFNQLWIVILDALLAYWILQSPSLYVHNVMPPEISLWLTVSVN